MSPPNQSLPFRHPHAQGDDPFPPFQPTNDDELLGLPELDTDEDLEEESFDDGDPVELPGEEEEWDPDA